MKAVAKAKVWANSKGVLVPDGSEDACRLVARAGQPMQLKEVSHFPNAAEFFHGLTPVVPVAPEQAPEAPRKAKIELEDDEISVPTKAPQKKRK